MARGALSWEVTLSRLSSELETPAMRRSLEVGVFRQRIQRAKTLRSKQVGRV